MEVEYTRPAFLASYFEAMKQKARDHGWPAIIPYWAIVGGCVGAGVTYFQPEDLFRKAEIIVPVYVGVLILNGLLLALSWSAFSRIHELIVSSPAFSVFLRRANLFNTFIFYIDYVEAAQLLAVLVSGAALLTCTMTSIPLLWARITLALTVGATIYAIRYAVNAVTVMHDLVWQKAIFDEQEIELATKVVKMGVRQASDN